ncbi:hypothetical protein BHE74_00035360 [Ensete ventricosum]|nr:hypothetical protein GW17_00049311 [Ensete ventricosum]RWW57863.1 hypothetical protein BHE74_00035360 [Ensete ventricosum]
MSTVVPQITRQGGCRGGGGSGGEASGCEGKSSGAGPVSGVGEGFFGGKQEEESVLDRRTGIITVTWGINSMVETMGCKLDLRPGTLDFPVDFDDLRWQKKSSTKGKVLYVEFDGRTHGHLKGPPAAPLTILQI